jgi:tRNA(fMet)-specific endonuclease VapC
MMFVLDASAFSAAMRNEVEMVSFLSSYRPGEIATVPPVVAEIEYGVERIDHETRKYTLLFSQKERLLRSIRGLTWDQGSSAIFGRIKAQLEKAGTPIDDFDVAIAAIAMSHEAVVITANLVHFQRIAGLSSRHWRTHGE